MRINELLQKIVNGEVVPDKIKFNENTYVFAGDDYSVDDEREEWLFSDGYTKFNMWLKEFLDEEVEIIQDEDKIQKIEVDSMNRIKATSTGNFVYSISQPMKIIINKLNEVTDKVNEVTDRLNKMEENK